MSDSSQYNDYVKGFFGSSAGAELWSRHGLYDPASNEGPYKYNNKIYRMQYVLDLAPRAPQAGARALDLGCGGGVYLPALHGKGYAVTGMDISQPMIDLSRELCDRLSVPAELRVGDCNATDLPTSHFDLCLCVGLIEHQQTDEPLLNEVKRILKPGGVLIVTARNASCPHINWRRFYRRIQPSLAAMKRLVLRRPAPGGPARPTGRGWDSRQHDPAALYRALRASGFDITATRYSHFYFLPDPLAGWFPRLEARMGKWLERLNGSPLGFLGSSMIVRATVKK